MQPVLPALLLLAAAAPALAQEAPAPEALAPVTPEAVEAAAWEGSDLPEGRSALTVKVQVLLDRAGVSPGVIDGVRGGMSDSAIRAYEAMRGLPVDGVLDAEVWEALAEQVGEPVLRAYEIAAEDAEGLTPDLPDDYGEMAALDRLDHERLAERLAERFHMDEDFLLALNPDAAWEPGETVTVADPGVALEGEVARIEVLKAEGRLHAYAEDGTLLASYPVTIGSDETPSPSGVAEVVTVAMEPVYFYNPERNFQQGDNTEGLELPPGPNGPVGSVWIDLSVPTYGLHGTSEPALLFESQSNGCVRLSNWDAEELAHLVREGTTVEFVEGAEAALR